MKFTHRIMQRAFCSRRSLIRRNKGLPIARRNNKQKLVKPFALLSLKKMTRSDGHVLSAQRDCLSHQSNSNGIRDTSDRETVERLISEYDEILVVTPNGLKGAVLKEGFDGIRDGIEKLLRQTLCPRIQKLTCLPVRHKSSEKLLIGLVLNEKCAYDSVIKGPVANDMPAAAAFRELWGQWAECRRFADLSTCEAVFFPAKTLAEKREIPLKIVQHVLALHFGISSANITSLGPDVSPILKPPHVQAERYGSGEEVLIRISALLEDLNKKIRSVKNLPLAVTSLHGISAVFRGAEVWPFAPEQSANVCVPVFEVVMKLETSGKWPDEINALRAVKYQLITETCARFRKELKLDCVPFPSHLDINYEGCVFRVIPSVAKEVNLLRQVKSRIGVLIAKLETCDEADTLYTQNNILTKLTGALNGINTRFVSYNTTCRLAKRWLSSQYMNGYIDDIVVELLVAHTFVTGSAPTTPLSGFIRFFRLLSSFPFQSQPLIFDPNQTFGEKEIANVQNFYRNMKQKPALFIVTPYDRKLGMFSREHGGINSAGVTKLLIECANKCHTQLMDMIVSQTVSSISSVFNHVVDKPHLIIHLKNKWLPHAARGAPLLRSQNPVVDYLTVLRRVFDDFAVFLCDVYSPLNQIIVYWKSLSFESKDMTTCELDDKLMLEPFLNSADRTVTLNVEAIIESFSLLGQGIVHKMESKVQNWPSK